MAFANKRNTALSFILNCVEQDGYDLSKLTLSQGMKVLWRGETDEEVRKM